MRFFTTTLPVLLFVVGCSTTTQDKASVSTPWEGEPVVRFVKTYDLQVALTFDDGPHPINTPLLLDLLKEEKIKATFYLVGQTAAAYPDITKRIIDEGHEIGNHSWSHDNFTDLSYQEIAKEIDKTNALLEKHSGVKPATFRPPYGALRPAQKTWIHEKYQWPIVYWSIDPKDWTRPGIGEVSRRIVSGIHPGAIVLFHDTHNTTIQAMPDIIEKLKSKKYEFVTISKLLASSQKQNHQETRLTSD
ncbi:MAG: polysaccharide deacetylase family protein [Verrucomicrobiota bacterium]